MPFVKRLVEPVKISNRPVPKELMFEFDCISNNTLVGAITQLASLVTHAEDLFAELSLECCQIIHRTDQLSQKVKHVSEKVSLLDSKAVEIRKYFRAFNLLLGPPVKLELTQLHCCQVSLV